MTNFEEQREFLRVSHDRNINYREVRVDKLSNRSEITLRNVSASGLLFRTQNLPPALSSTVWLELDDKMISICREIESDLVIKDNGLLGRVVRLAEGEPGISYDVGVCFLRRKRMTDGELSAILSVKDK